MEHSGSTAVPGLCVKPVIDIVLRLPEGQNRPDVDEQLLAAGWSPRPTCASSVGSGRTPRTVAGMQI